MKKVLVIGSGGVGKSTLSVQLGAALGLPVVHLDRLHWKPGWTAPDRDEWQETVTKLVAADEWVMDGNYGGSLNLRIPAADTIIYMDFPPLICLWRVIKRRFRYRNADRPDMAPGCQEQLNWAFMKWIWGFRKKQRPRILKSLETYSENKAVVVLTGPSQVSSFLG